jgi:non-ribosomal peptide synthetase component E (peptide arylation enzyme)
VGLATVICKPKIPIINYIAEEVNDDNFKTSWIYNTGASVHICNDWSRFVSFKSRETVIRVGDTSTQCEEVGNMILYLTKLLDKILKDIILLKKV